MNIKEARQFAGLSVKEVSDLTGIPYRSLQNWEIGLRVPPEYVEEYLVQKLCQERQIARIRVSVKEVIIEVLTDKDFELHSSAPIKDGLIPLNILITIGQLSEAGYKIIYL